MNFENLQLMWDEDSKINDLELDVSALKIPQLHSKYMKFFSDYRFRKKEAEIKLKILRKEKFEYYSGKADQKIYAEKPFDLKVLKTDINLYIDSDEDIVKQQMKIDSFEIILDYLESVLKMIANRSFQLKNVIEWRKFIDGVT